MSKTLSHRAAGLTYFEASWGCIIKGTRDELTQRGITHAGPFPGDPDAAKTSLRTTNPAGQKIHISRASKHLFKVQRDWTEEEDHNYQARAARLKKIQEAKKVVGGWPKTAQQFREEARARLDFGLCLIEIIFAAGDRGGFRYDDDSIGRVSLLLGQIRATFEEGRIVMDREMREQHTPPALRGALQSLDAARADRDFQQFMKGIGRVGDEESTLST